MRSRSYEEHRAAFEFALRHRNGALAAYHLRRMKELNEDAEDIIVASSMQRLEAFLADGADGDYDGS